MIIPGNHDHYNDEDFNYYLAHSIQGSANGTTQHDWVKTCSFGTYHFIGASTPGNDGASFSIWSWDDFGDHAGLDTQELAFIYSRLAAHPEAELTLIFGHHPFQAGYYASTDTGLTYGLSSLLNLIDGYGVSMYGFGHTHDYRENFYSDGPVDGVFYLNVSSLGKADSVHYAIMAAERIAPIDWDIDVSSGMIACFFSGRSFSILIVPPSTDRFSIRPKPPARRAP